MWFDALGNYLTALDYAKDGENLHRWWTGFAPLIHRYLGGHVPAAAASAPGAAALEKAAASAPRLIAAALEDFDFRRATEAVWQVADEANRYASHARPWDLAKPATARNWPPSCQRSCAPARRLGRRRPASCRTPRPASPASAPRTRPGCSRARRRSCPRSPCQPLHPCPRNTGQSGTGAEHENLQVSCRFQFRLSPKESLTGGLPVVQRGGTPAHPGSGSPRRGCPTRCHGRRGAPAALVPRSSSATCGPHLAVCRCRIGQMSQAARRAPEPQSAEPRSNCGPARVNLREPAALWLLPVPENQLAASALWTTTGSPGGLPIWISSRMPERGHLVLPVRKATGPGHVHAS